MAGNSLSTSARCDELLASLTDEERARLTQFTACRVTHFGIDPQEIEDLSQQAKFAVVRGIGGNGGRNPNPEDLESHEAFENYMRGVINSVVEARARSNRRVDWNTCSLEELPEVLPTKADTFASAAHADLLGELFKRLWERAPARLHPTLRAWEQDPHAKVPCVTTRKHTYALRLLAQQIARELGFGPKESGKPMKKAPPRASSPKGETPETPARSGEAP